MKDQELKEKARDIILQGCKEVGIELKHEIPMDQEIDNYEGLQELISNKDPKGCLRELFYWTLTGHPDYWESIKDLLNSKLYNPIELSQEPKLIEPKLMMVSDDPIDSDNTGVVSTVFMTAKGYYYTWVETNLKAINGWKYAKEIPKPKKITRQEILDKFDCEDFEIIND